MLAVSMDALKAAAQNFHTVSGMVLVLYNEKRQILYAYPEKMCAFCAAVRQSKTLANRCIDCDHIGFDECDKTREPYIYRCFMGLTEAIAPIIENEMIIGYLMLGQVLCDGEEAALLSGIAYASQHGLDAEELKKKSRSLRRASKEVIASAVEVMRMCASYLYYNRIVWKHLDFAAVQLKDYMEAHFCEPLSAESLCTQFYLSKTKLYRLSERAVGMAPSAYIRKLRLDKAKQLLKNTDLPVHRIAAEVGFDDANYFVRLFTKYEGVTPGKYRNNPPAF